MMTRPIMIMAGGTGGHVFPAIAVAQELQQCGQSVLWLGSENGMESRIVPRFGFQFIKVKISGIRGKSLRLRLQGVVNLLVAVSQSLIIMAKYRPLAVLGMGGFVSGPGGIAAWLMRIPLLIHEQNAVAGVTNKLLAKFANYVLEAFPATFPQHKHLVHTGNPVRAEILDIPPPEIRFSERTGPYRVLIVGGSQGAEILNQTVPRTMALLPDLQLEIIHQVGRNKQDSTSMLYNGVGVSAQIQEFIEDMAQAYAWADLIICRSGALTVAELAAAGVPSILVPFPAAVDDHQTVNARYLSEAGAAYLLPQSDLTADVLAQLLGKMLVSRAELLTMAKKARKLVVSNATKQVANLCLEAAKVRL